MLSQNFLLSQDTIKDNANLLIEALLKIFPREKVTKLNEEGSCHGLSVCYAENTTPEEKEEYLNNLMYLQLLDTNEDTINRIVSDYKNNPELVVYPLWDGAPIHFGKLIKLLKKISIAQANQSIADQLGGNWTKTLSFIGPENTLEHHLENKLKNIEIGDIVFMPFISHTFCIIRTKEGFYLFEPNKIRKTSLDPTILTTEEKLTQEIINDHWSLMNCFTDAEENIFAFSMQFFSYGIKESDRELESILIKFNNTLIEKTNTFTAQECQAIKPLLSILRSYYSAKSMSRLDLVEALLDALDGIPEQNNIEFIPQLIALKEILKKYISENDAFLIQINDSFPYVKKTAYSTHVALLHLAIKSNQIALVKKLIGLGVDINAKCTNKGVTPLHLAVNHDIDLTIVNLLIQNGADVNGKSNDGATPLFTVVRQGRIEIVELFLAKGAEVNLVDKKNNTPLFIAVLSENLEIAQLLLNYKADINKTYNGGGTLLFFAAYTGNLNKAKFLVENGAEIDKAADHNTTPLFIAVQQRQPEIAELLIKHGANVNHQPNNGGTLLCLAAETNCLETAKILIQNNANVNQECIGSKNTPLFFVIEDGYLELADFLLKNGADANKINSNNTTLLYLASVCNQPEIAKLLLEHGADVNKGSGTVTPLFIAAQKGQLDIVKLLIENKADINIPFQETKNNLLKFAKQFELTKKMECFIQKKKGNRNVIHITPVEIAELMGHKEIVLVLYHALGKSISLRTHPDFGMFQTSSSKTETDKTGRRRCNIM